jgi:nicotinamide mononucleotide transporter
MSALEIAGTILGVLGVGLMIRQSIWGWPVGLVQVSLYAWIFFEARLYSDSILQLIFIGLQSYGWWHWHQARRDPAGVAPELPVTLSASCCVRESAMSRIRKSMTSHIRKSKVSHASP